MTKRLVFLLLAAACLSAVRAQTAMHVYFNGQHHIFPTEKIDSIVFASNEVVTVGDGTLTNPFSCDDAIGYVKSLGADVQSPRDVYVKGKVASVVTAFSTQFGNATFYISADGTTKNTFEAYRILYLGNRKWQEGDMQIAVGDEVVLCGRVVHYQGRVPETVSGLAYVYSINGKTTNGEEPPADQQNLNANDASQTKALGSLEFPHVKGGTSSVIIHETDDYGRNYAIEWDHSLKAQRWTCYYFCNANNVTKWNRSNWQDTEWGGDPFQLDPLVPRSEQPAVKGEFSGSYYPDGTQTWYDRGHICASQDRMCSQQVNKQTFYMTNMMPQVNTFNSGIWSKMESKVRYWNNNNTRDTLFVVKGGTIDQSDQILAYTKNRFPVPRYFFMALLCKKNGQYKALAFWAEHLNEDHSSDNLANYVVSIRQLEQLTGIDFFCNLPDQVEEQVETASADDIKRAWGL